MPPSDQRLKASDFRVLDKVIDTGNGSGYVLDFTNPTFSEFFQDELGVNIDDPRFSAEGTSKGKRLRYFLRTVDCTTIHKTLVALWEYRNAAADLATNRPLDPKAENAFRKIVERFGDSLPGKPADSAPETAADPVVPESMLARLAERLMEISMLEPQPRGYAFEKFLKEVFDAYGLAGKDAFRLTGEQIDGSFEFGHETYLLEAKWQNEKTGAKDLRDFQGKVEAKAAWSRGLFVSNSGFTEVGLEAFGGGKRIICMDGLDLYEIFHNRRSFTESLRLKVRYAAETGRPYVSVRELL